MAKIDDLYQKALLVTKGNPRVESMIRRHGGKMMAFAKLPLEGQLAMAHYMAIDGEAWEIPGDWNNRDIYPRNLSKMLPYFRREHGNEKFGYVVIPMSDLVASIEQDPGVEGDFKNWYTKGTIGVQHSSSKVWPIILEREGPETIQDGSHRFARYYDLGIKNIPALYYRRS